MVDSASGYKKAGMLKVLKSQLDVVINCLNDLDISKDQHLKEQAVEYFTAGLQGQNISDDVARHTDIEEEHSQAVRESSPSPEMVGKIKTPEFGRAYRVTWNKFTLKELPLVVFKHTQLTRDEQEEIDSMEIPQLLDRVRSECPERENLLFPKGFDGMEVSTMRRRLKNQLRLNMEELTELTNDGTRKPKKKKLLDYLNTIRPGLMRES